MKKLFVMILAMIMVLGMLSSSFAETVVFNRQAGTVSSEWVCAPCHTVTEGLFERVLSGVSAVLLSRDGTQYIPVAPDGTLLAGETEFDGYDMELNGTDAICRLKKDGKMGALVANGQAMLPAIYDEIYHSQKWSVGMVYRKTEENEECDVYDQEGSPCIIHRADLYYIDTKVAELDEASYKEFVRSFGDYCSIAARDGSCTWYNKNGEPTAAYDVGGWFEYDGMIHQASGQKAFVSGCTLKANEVCDAYHLVTEYDVQDESVKANVGDVLDLQGNVLFTVDSAILEEMKDSDVFYYDGMMALKDSGERIVVFSMDGTLLADFVGKDFESIEYAGALSFVSPEGNCFLFVQPSCEKTDLITLPEGYEIDHSAANYVLAKNSEADHYLLYSAGGMVDLGNYHSDYRDMGEELLIVHNDTNQEYLLIDLQGNIVLESCIFLCTHDMICIDGNGTICTLSKN